MPSSAFCTDVVSTRVWIKANLAHEIGKAAASPGRLAENLVMFIRQNQGRLGSKRRGNEFAKLTRARRGCERGDPEPVHIVRDDREISRGRG
jgi:hypothetical protein